MVSTLSWILLGVGIYWITILWLRNRGMLPSYIGTQGPILTIHTRRFRIFLDRIAQSKRVWRAWGNYGVGVAVVVMLGSFLFLAFAALATVQNPTPTAVNQPQNVLVIPGVNDFLPLSVAPEIVLGLLIGLVVHEGGHGVFCRVGNIDIKSMGIALIAFIPIGAFVEPDEESRQQASRGDQTRMFSAGVMNNFAITIVTFGLLFGPVIGSIGVAPGAAVGGVLPDSAAAEAGVEQGDRIIAVNGENIQSNEELEETLAKIDEREVTVTLEGRDSTRTTTVRRSLLVTGIVAGTPFAGPIGVRTQITGVNGSEVHTEQAFKDAVMERPIATIETADDRSVTGPIGAAVVIRENGPAAATGLSDGTPAVITSIDGERVISANDLSEFLEGTEAGQSVAVTFYIHGEPRTIDLTLGSHPTRPHGFIGVDVAPGISGITISDFGTRLYPAPLYLGLLGGDGGAGGSFFARMITALQLPLASVTGSGLPFNFAGFAGGVENFYVVQGPFSRLSGIVFGFANVLFWTGWINLNLGVFNCIPAYPLDGGHILRSMTEAFVSRLPVRRRRDLTTVVTTSVGLAMLVSLLVTLFGPQLLT